MLTSAIICKDLAVSRQAPLHSPVILRVLIDREPLARWAEACNYSPLEVMRQTLCPPMHGGSLRALISWSLALRLREDEIMVCEHHEHLGLPAGLDLTRWLLVGRRA